MRAAVGLTRYQTALARVGVAFAIVHAASATVMVLTASGTWNALVQVGLALGWAVAVKVYVRSCREER